jgi:hypothetical protein
MRTNLCTALLVAVAVLAPAAASADSADSLVGRYDVAFTPVMTNCAAGGLTLDRSTIAVTKRAPGIAVELPKVATLSGTAARAGRLKAASKAAKAPGSTLDGKFSIAGTIDDGKLDAVLVAEFFNDGKPVCTQSWSAIGTRVAEAKPAAAPAPSRFSSLLPIE